jgi:SAM-dependent methyltransferase
MAHPGQIWFCENVKKQFPNHFKNVTVLDIGSLDINGNNRYLFENYTYTGVDLAIGLNVDVVSRGHLYKTVTQYDVVISTECFEHDEYYDLTIKNMYKLLKPNGLFMFTCASPGRPEHGTLKSFSSEAAPFVCELNDYYKNLSEIDIRKVIHVDNLFSEYNFFQRDDIQDLYFYGIKK